MSLLSDSSFTKGFNALTPLNPENINNLTGGGLGFETYMIPTYVFITLMLMCIYYIMNNKKSWIGSLSCAWLFTSSGVVAALTYLMMSPDPTQSIIACLLCTLVLCISSFCVFSM